jgi:transcriptional regulator with AAA-type ATPase domain/serine/threonine protein kinase
VIPGASASSFPELLGESAAMRSVQAQIGRALVVDLPVLLEGETGTGKDLAAWLIHHRGPRRAGPFVTLNCASMDEALLESELFGHRRGAFTGADRSGPGLLMAARSGTLFLDEVGELSSGAQCKLLRAVESGEVLPVGAKKARRTDARIIAATGASLEAAVEAGSFRRDLYHRLRVLTLRLPPLRDRREDIPLLAERLLEAVCGRLRVPPHRLSRAALAALAAAPWPGNVRQLIHELGRAVVVSEGLEIGLAHLSPELQGRAACQLPGRHAGRSMERVSLHPSEVSTGPSSPPAPDDAAVDSLLRRLAGLSEPRQAAVHPAAPSIGGYRLIERIAEGGMGEVWRAEQREPVRREVAVKLIKAGMDTRLVVARFEAERQALALMDHPAIAKVLAGGSTDRGRPYLVMEYVRGVSLDRHCDQAHLPLPARIELFRQVCAGVQHAHQKAILHRDLKPANVLVTLTDGKPQTKIVDFGIAKALAQPLTDRTLQTEMGQMVGTLAYMSPEQADLTPQDVDTRSDVYSLGVMLYQLLSGFLPLFGPELSGSGPEGLRRRIHEMDPPPPSARLAAATEEVVAIARKRNSQPGRLRREMAGDLDAIVMKALEKDRARRYESAAALSADLGRYLEHQPVMARRPGAASRMARYVRRHRAGIAAAAGLLLLLHIGFSAGLALQLRQAHGVTDVLFASKGLPPAAAPARYDEDARLRRRWTRYLGKRGVEAVQQTEHWPTGSGNRGAPPAADGRPPAEP